MTMLLIGASYRNMPLGNLEKLESSAEEIRTILFSDKSDMHGIEAAVLVSTCNRFEIYIDADDALRARQFVVSAIKKSLGEQAQDLTESLIHIEGADAIAHLFAVTSGMDSMVVGEVEISGQIKRALAEAQSLGQTSKILEALFQKASAVSKKVTFETGLGAAGRSLITTAIDIVAERYFPVNGKKILVIGTGAYARVVVAALNRAQAGEILVYSPSGRAEEFSESRPTTPIKQSQLLGILRQVDVIVGCSGNHGAVISVANLQDLPQKMLPVIDLSLSADIEPGAGALENISLINLEEIFLNAPVEHQETIDQAAEIIKTAVIDFQEELMARASDPMIRSLRAHVEKIVSQEVERVSIKFGEEHARVVERSLHLVTKTIFHRPMLSARATAIAGEQDKYQHAIEVLFGLEVAADFNE